MASFAYESEDSDQESYLSIQVHPPVVQPLEALSKSFATEFSDQSMANKLQHIDQEILILRAELSLRRGELEQVREYISKLNRMVIIPEFKLRIAYLKQFLISGRNTGLATKIRSKFHSEEITSVAFTPQRQALLTVNSIQPLDFPSNKKNAVLVVLLPLSDDYEQVGNQLFNSLNQALAQQGFDGTVAIFDTTQYESAYDLWAVIQAYQPDFIFGPLQKKMVAEWHALKTGIPTLFFNEIDALNGFERSLSPNKFKGLEQVFLVLDHNLYENVLVVTDQSEASKNLELEFYQAWTARDKVGLYQHYEVDKFVSQTVEIAINAQVSKERKAWLQRIIKKQLTFSPRTRDDFDVIISFLPENKSLLISPMLDFYQLTDMAHIWYPSQIPQADSLKSNLSSWQRTIAVLPAYVQPPPILDEPYAEANDKTGLFYALGQLAIEIVNNPAIINGMDLYIESEFGAITSNSDGQFYLLPVVYWIDQGNIEIVSELLESPTE
ncbi:MAG: hypothetical protein ISEC1_P0055 [Thiomicrorhabdus sp.]|nr:MAG: hypothetical protein ISEC1_P0055 [Thiomicrorhabdus sp.]